MKTSAIMTSPFARRIATLGRPHAGPGERLAVAESVKSVKSVEDLFAGDLANAIVLTKSY